MNAKCLGCGKACFQYNSLVKPTCPECAYKVSKGILKSRDKELKAMKRRVNNLDTKKQMGLAQENFNRFIRFRDWNNPCISCGALPHRFVKQAGHYYSVGARSDLRFNEDNCHLQCKKCNFYTARGDTHYESAILDKIGKERVAALTLVRTIKRTALDYVAIKKKYAAASRLMKLERGIE